MCKKDRQTSSNLQTEACMLRSEFRDAELPTETMAQEMDGSKFQVDTIPIKSPEMNVGKFRRQQSVGLGGVGGEVTAEQVG